MTEGDLRNAEARYRRAAARAEEARLYRNGIVGKALKQRWTHARISQATRSDPADPRTGLSRGRINQLSKADSKEAA